MTCVAIKVAGTNSRCIHFLRGFVLKSTAGVKRFITSKRVNTFPAGGNEYPKGGNERIECALLVGMRFVRVIRILRLLKI